MAISKDTRRPKISPRITKYLRNNSRRSAAAHRRAAERPPTSLGGVKSKRRLSIR